MSLYLIAASMSSREGEQAFHNALHNLDARKISDVSWLLSSSVSGPKAIGGYLSSLLEDSVIVVCKVDGEPFFSKSDDDLALPRNLSQE